MTLECRTSSSSRIAQWQDLADTSQCDAGPSALPPIDPAYGCSAGGVDGTASACAVIVAGLLLRKRRR